MTLDERIKEALQANSTWSGSPDELWAKVAAQLPPKRQRWRQPFGLGTAAAAVLVLAFVLYAVWNPNPPSPPVVEDAPQLRMFSAVLPAFEPLLVEGGAEIELAVDVSLAADSTERPPHLEIWAEGEERSLTAVMDLDGGALLRTRSLTVQAPEEPGSYRLVVSGAVQEAGQLYQVHGELTIVVQSADQ